MFLEGNFPKMTPHTKPTTAPITTSKSAPPISLPMLKSLEVPLTFKTVTSLVSGMTSSTNYY